MTEYTSYSHQLPVSTTPIDDMYIALGQSPPSPFKFFSESISEVFLKTTVFFPNYGYRPYVPKNISPLCSEQPFSKTFKLIKSR